MEAQAAVSELEGLYKTASAPFSSHYPHTLQRHNSLPKPTNNHPNTFEMDAIKYAAPLPCLLTTIANSLSGTPPTPRRRPSSRASLEPPRRPTSRSPRTPTHLSPTVPPPARTLSQTRSLRRSTLYVHRTPSSPKSITDTSQAKK